MLALKGKRVLVTGSAGFLGGHVLAALSGRGVPERNLVLPKREKQDLRLWEECVRAVKGVSVVLHLAGVTGDTEFHERKPAETFYDNLIMGAYLMEAAREAGVEKFVTIGSATEYPECAPLPFREGDLWLGYPEIKHAPYTVAKKMLAVQAHAYNSQYTFRAAHLLMTNMYGPGQRVESSFVIPALIKNIFKAQKNGAHFIEMTGSGNETRDFIYVKDAAEAVLLAAERHESPEPVNVASGWEISMRELAAIIKDLMGFSGEVRFNASIPGGQLRRVLDTTRARLSFGFQAITDFRTGLRETIDEYVPRLCTADLH